MAQVSRQIANIPLDISTAGTVNTLLDPLDLSHAKAVTLVLRMSTAATDAGDTLDVKLQTTFDDPTSAGAVWDTRIYPLQVTGITDVTNTYTQVFNLSQDVDLTTAERGYVATGSTGGAELTPGTVRDGMFPPRYRNAQGPQANWRLQTVTVDAGTANVHFVGTAEILVHEWDIN